MHRGGTVQRGCVRAEGDDAVQHRSGDREPDVVGVVSRGRRRGCGRSGDGVGRSDADGALLLHGKLLARDGAGDVGRNFGDLPTVRALQGRRPVHGGEPFHQRHRGHDLPKHQWRDWRGRRVFHVCVRQRGALRLHVLPASGDTRKVSGRDRGSAGRRRGRRRASVPARFPRPACAPRGRTLQDSIASVRPQKCGEEVAF
mmetsp:Transcript_6969/g.17344  ORF Transcript_6969/g.17344 Transcript_6969/m.17344 type:complete len:200 (-) Transcript_6969:336-935(-)